MRKRTKQELITSIILNSILILIELFCFAQAFFQFMPFTEKIKWYQMFTYYTELSNFMLLIGSVCSLINAIFELQNKKVIYYLSLIKYISVSVVGVTFLTVYFFVLITFNPVYGVSMHGHLWLFLHTINPILGYISYYFFDEKIKVKYINVIYPLIFTFIYTFMIEIIYLNNGRLPYVSDFSDEPIKVNFVIILLMGLTELCVTFISSLINLLIKNKYLFKKWDLFLNEEPFDVMKNGTKRIEMRLNDENKSQIQVSDLIVFTSRKDNSKILTKVTKVSKFKDFEELYSKIENKTLLGYKVNEEASFHDMEIYYPIEKIKHYGALGIYIKILDYDYKDK